MTFFDELQHTTRQERDALLGIPFIKAGAVGSLRLESYVAFLSQAYHHVKHTVPLLMACGARLPERLEWLRTAVGEYIEEEMGHQEWILNDIAHCGFDSETVRHGTPAFETELMVAYAYDVIAHGNPIGFFGMVQVLEGTSIAVATSAAQNLQRNLDLPNKAFSYLYSHGSLDIEHVDFFKGLMNRVSEADDQHAIVYHARRFYRLYGDIFRALPLHQYKEYHHEVA